MASFKDNGGNEWQIEFDAFLLHEVKQETGIDLADIAAGGWLQIETDSAALGRVLAAVCRAEIKQKHLTDRDFAKRIRGAVIEAAREALRTEAADFFPASEWSAIRLNLATRTEAKTQATAIQTAMSALEGMSPDFRAGALEALRQAMTDGATDGISSARSEAGPFASGPDAIPLTNATPEQGNAE